MKNNFIQSILYQVPVNYYENGVEHNILQKLWHYGKVQTVQSLLNDIRYKSILDIGCASGWFLNQILLKNNNIQKAIGVDLYNPAIIFGKKKYKHIKFINADIHKIPLKPNSIDLILCCEVLEHVSDPRKVLSEMKRIVRKKGNAIIEMDTGNLIFHLVWWIWKKGKGRVWNNSHIQVFNKEKLTKMIKQAGFKIINQKIFNISMGVAFLIQKE